MTYSTSAMPPGRLPVTSSAPGPSASATFFSLLSRKFLCLSFSSHRPKFTVGLRHEPQ